MRPVSRLQEFQRGWPSVSVAYEWNLHCPQYSSMASIGENLRHANTNGRDTTYWIMNQEITQGGLEIRLDDLYDICVVRLMNTTRDGRYDY